MAKYEPVQYLPKYETAEFVKVPVEDFAIAEVDSPDNDAILTAMKESKDAFFRTSKKSMTANRDGLTEKSYYEYAMRGGTSLPLGDRVYLNLGGFVVQLLHKTPKGNLLEYVLTTEYEHLTQVDPKTAFNMIEEVDYTSLSKVLDVTSGKLFLKETNERTRTRRDKKTDEEDITISSFSKNDYEGWRRNMALTIGLLKLAYNGTEGDSATVAINRVRAIRYFIATLFAFKSIRDDGLFVTRFIRSLSRMIRSYLNIFPASVYTININYNDVVQYDLLPTLTDNNKLFEMFETYFYEKQRGKIFLAEAKVADTTRLPDGLKIKGDSFEIPDTQFDALMEAAVSASILYSHECQVFKDYFPLFKECAKDATIRSLFMRNLDVKGGFILPEQFEILLDKLNDEKYTYEGSLINLSETNNYMRDNMGMLVKEFVEFVDTFFVKVSQSTLQLTNTTRFALINRKKGYYRFDFFSPYTDIVLPLRVHKMMSMIQGTGSTKELIDIYPLQSYRVRAGEGGLIDDGKRAFDIYKNSANDLTFWGSDHLQKEVKLALFKSFLKTNVENLIKGRKDGRDSWVIYFDKYAYTIKPPKTYNSEVDIYLKNSLRELSTETDDFECVTIDSDADPIDLIFGVNREVASMTSDQLQRVYEERLNNFGKTNVNVLQKYRLSTAPIFTIRTPNNSILQALDGGCTFSTDSMVYQRTLYFNYKVNELVKSARSKMINTTLQCKLDIPVPKTLFTATAIEETKENGVLYQSNVMRFNNSKHLLTIYKEAYPDSKFIDCFHGVAYLDLSKDITFNSKEWSAFGEPEKPSSPVRLILKNYTPETPNLNTLDGDKIVFCTSEKIIDDVDDLYTNRLYCPFDPLETILACVHNLLLELIHKSSDVATIRKSWKDIVAGIIACELNTSGNYSWSHDKAKTMPIAGLPLNKVIALDDEALSDDNFIKDALELFDEVWGEDNNKKIVLPINRVGNYTKLIVDSRNGKSRLTELNRYGTVNSFPVYSYKFGNVDISNYIQAALTLQFNNKAEKEFKVL
jgi:hypothetical protein